MSSNLDVSWLRTRAEECRKDAEKCNRRARSFLSWFFGDRHFWREAALSWRKLAEDRGRLADELEAAAERVQTLADCFEGRTGQIHSGNLMRKSVYHILEPIVLEDDGQEYAKLRHIPTDTLEGVYANMAQHGMTPGSVIVIYGHTVTLDPKRFEAHYEEVRKRIATAGKEERRKQYERLRAEFESD